jgi:hypothetical protein
MSDLGPLQESYFESILAWMENRSGRDLSLVTAPSPPYPMDDPLPDFSDPLPVTYLSYFTLRSGEFYVAVMVAGEDFGVYLGFEALHPSNSFFGFYQTTDKSDDARNSMFYFAFGDGTRYAGVQHTEETSGYCVGINLDAPQEQFLGIYQWQAQNQTWNFSYQYSSPGYRGLALWTQDYPTFVGYAADNPGQYFWMVSMFSGGEAPVYSYWILWHGVTLMEENS